MAQDRPDEVAKPMVHFQSAMAAMDDENCDDVGIRAPLEDEPAVILERPSPGILPPNFSRILAASKDVTAPESSDLPPSPKREGFLGRTKEEIVLDPHQTGLFTQFSEYHDGIPVVTLGAMEGPTVPKHDAGDEPYMPWREESPFWKTPFDARSEHARYGSSSTHPQQPGFIPETGQARNRSIRLWTKESSARMGTQSPVVPPRFGVPRSFAPRPSNADAQWIPTSADPRIKQSQLHHSSLKSPYTTLPHPFPGSDAYSARNSSPTDGDHNVELLSKVQALSLDSSLSATSSSSGSSDTSGPSAYSSPGSDVYSPGAGPSPLSMSMSMSPEPCSATIPSQGPQPAVAKEGSRTSSSIKLTMVPQEVQHEHVFDASAHTIRLPTHNKRASPDHKQRIISLTLNPQPGATSSPPAKTPPQPNAAAATRRKQGQRVRCTAWWCVTTFRSNYELKRHLLTSRIHVGKAEGEHREKVICSLCGNDLSRGDSRMRHEANVACGKRTRRRKPVHPKALTRAPPPEQGP
ncbi:hypothetical protein FPV67DRAFT_116824 [Lyophyllum atratum]|nr:hypothetical protein FPV67DRAFT_116824 [Lyophyllum atratum]